MATWKGSGGITQELYRDSVAVVLGCRAQDSGLSVYGVGFRLWGDYSMQGSYKNPFKLPRVISGGSNADKIESVAES